MANKPSSLSDKLAKKNRSGKVEFIAQKQEIEDAIAKGWPIKKIWDQLHSDNKITFSYAMFLRYAKELILNKNKPTDAEQSVPTPPSSTENQQEEIKNEENNKPKTKAEKEPIKASLGKEGSNFKADPTRAAKIDKNDLY